MALGIYLKLAAEGDGESIPVPAQTVRPGDSYAGMALLVARLNQLGDAGPEVGNQLVGGTSIYQGASLTR
jgi:hypothetical protein